MLVTPGNTFLAQYSNQTTPSVTPSTSITPGNNSFPAYAEILSDTVVVEDCYAIAINICSNAVGAAARDTLVTLGFDPAGGTSYTDTISNLLGSCASQYTVGTTGGVGIWYYFPLWIKAGTAIAAKASVNNATVGTLRVWIKLYAKPTRPDLLRCGTFVTTLGATTASSSGTAVTPGTSGAEGAYVSLGTPSVPHWYWECGMGVNDGTMTTGMQHVDIAAGDATNKFIVRQDVIFITGSTESITKHQQVEDAYREVEASLNIYGRVSNSIGTNDSNYSLCAYGVGG